MFGVPLDGPFNVICDNQEVVNNTILPQSNVGKKHNAVNGHVVCKASTARILRVGKEDTETSLDDILKNSWAVNNSIRYSHLKKNGLTMVKESTSNWACVHPLRRLG